MNANAIEFRNVSKKFKKGEKFNSLRDSIPNLFRSVFLKKQENGLGKQEFWALKDVSFQIKQGEVVGIIGPNGAGKSTILKLLSRIMNPNKGEIKIKGRLSALIEVAAGFHPELTGKENIYLNGTILGMTRKEIDSKFDEIVEFSGLSEFIDTPVKRYSSGMFSRLGFSVAAHMDPDVLLVDEVLAVGDISFQAKCAQKIRELFNSGVTILLVSHNLSLIKNLCSRVVLLNKGEVIKEGNPDEIIPYYQDVTYMEMLEDLKRKSSHSSYKIKIKQETIVDIFNVSLFDRIGKYKQDFSVEDSISIKVDYEAKEEVSNPVFVLEIIRFDEVLCCSSTTKENNFVIDALKEKGVIYIDLGRINLAPGVYSIKISIWDKNMIHLYTARKKDIFRIKAIGTNAHINTVFLPKITWRFI